MQQPLTSKVQGNILYEPSLFGNPDAQLFDAMYWRSRGASSIKGGRGQVLFIRDDEHSWVLRHYLRGGWVAKFNKDWYAWRGAECTRSFREWRLLAKLVELQLPVPTPVAARYVRNGFGYRADLITQEILDARSLSSVLEQTSLAPEQWQLIGETLARFHHCGVQHADLNAHNIVFDHSQRLFVLDFDRGVIRTPNRYWIDNVLARLLRSLNKLKLQRNIHFSATDWQHLIKAHDDALSIS